MGYYEYNLICLIIIIVMPDNISEGFIFIVFFNLIPVVSTCRVILVSGVQYIDSSWLCHARFDKCVLHPFTSFTHPPPPPFCSILNEYPPLELLFFPKRTFFIRSIHQTKAL